MKINDFILLNGHLTMETHIIYGDMANRSFRGNDYKLDQGIADASHSKLKRKIYDYNLENTDKFIKLQLKVINMTVPLKYQRTTKRGQRIKFKPGKLKPQKIRLAKYYKNKFSLINGSHMRISKKKAIKHLKSLETNRRYRDKLKLYSNGLLHWSSYIKVSVLYL